MFTPYPVVKPNLRSPDLHVDNAYPRQCVSSLSLAFFLASLMSILELTQRRRYSRLWS
jgi:hypothetical protein